MLNVENESKIKYSAECLKGLAAAFEDCLPTHASFSHGASLVFQAAILIRRGELADAKKCLDHALAKDEQLARIQYGRALVSACIWEQTKQQDLLADAAKDFEFTTRSEPTWAPGYYQLGLLLEKAGHPLAIECIKAAAHIDPSRPEYLVKLSNIQMWTDRNTDQALNTFEKALSLDPDLLEAYDQTNFYQKYLVGDNSPGIAQHVRSSDMRRTARRRAHQIDLIRLRNMPGIAPYIGHYSYIDSVAKMIQLGWLGSERVAIFTEPTAIVNPALMRLWTPHVPAITDPLTIKQFEPLLKFMTLDYTDVQGFNDRFASDDWRLMAGVEEEWERQRRAPLLSLSPEEIDRGWRGMEALGVPRGSWFVSVHVRDDGFKGPEAAHSLRNADINTYSAAFKAITDRGGYVLRMGGPQMTPIKPMAQVIDYAHSNCRSDWMDVFLWSQCRFFIGGNSGPTWIPRSFGTPTLMVNWAPLTRIPWTSKDIVIPKMFSRNGSLIPFRELVDPRGPVEWIHSAEVIKERGLQPIDNSPDELQAVVLEMIQRVDGTASYSEQHESLQRDLSTLVRERCAGFKQSDRTCRLGREYLERYQYLL